LDRSEHLQLFPELGRALERTALNNRLIPRTGPSGFAVATAFVMEGR
jgi:hypothetical protein